MKKYIFIPILFISFLSWGQAQFVIQNASKTEVYTNINDAITNAVAGDTLYIPGGGFTIANTTITKALHWVGHGHYPDSTQATMQSRIISTLYFNSTCSGSSFEGIYFTGELHFGYNNIDVSNITMKRCRLGSNLYLRKTNVGTPNLNFIIQECVLRYINANNGSGCSIEKSLLFSTINYFYQSNFTHNDINADAGSSGIIYGCNFCTFTDNVFAYEYGAANSTSCTFENNVFPGGLPSTSGGTFIDNLTNVGSDIYTSVTNNYTFTYDDDYHLKTNWLSSDGVTNCGIYGTTTPYKTIPYYPHINTATIDNEATNNQLGVEINVKAQSR